MHKQCTAMIFGLFLLTGMVLAQDNKLQLRPIDPNPIPFPNPNLTDTFTDENGKIVPQGWTLTNAEWSMDETEEFGVFHVLDQGACLSDAFPINPGVYYFQIDHITSKPGRPEQRAYVTVGNADYGFMHDTLYVHRNRTWTTFPHFFRIPESESEMQLRIQVYDYKAAPDSHKPENQIQVDLKNIQLLPALAVPNAAVKNEPLRDIYWGRNIGVSHRNPVGEYLPLGRWERIEQDYQTKRTFYRFDSGWNSANPWGNTGFGSEPVIKTPPVSLDTRPFEKMIVDSTLTSWMGTEEMIWKFELQPIQVFENGEYALQEHIPLRSAELGLSIEYGNWGVLSRFKPRPRYASLIDYYWSHDGKEWNKLVFERGVKTQYYGNSGGSLPPEIFPCDTLYIKISCPEKSTLKYFQFYADLGMGKFYDHGQTSYFIIEPSDEKQDSVNMWPLFTARNQVFFLYRNDSDKPVAPKFAVTHKYIYVDWGNWRGLTERAEIASDSIPDQVTPGTVEGNERRGGEQVVSFQAVGNKAEEFDDITCYWEVIGEESGMIPPHSERICVYTLETSKLRASSHAQYGPNISDEVNTVFDLGNYRMINETMRFFPPRLAIE